MKSSRTSLVIISVLVIMLIVWLIAINKQNASRNQPIKIGVITPLTGPFADYGEQIKKGVLTIGTSSDFSFDFGDEQCDPKQTVTAFHKLTDVDGVHFIIGPGCGSPQEAIVPLLANKKVVVVVPSAASSDLFAKSGGYFFNVQYSLENESKFNAEKMYDMGYKKVALLTYDNAFSTAHANSFKKNFKGKIAYETVLVDDSVSLLPELTKIKAAGVDAIYAPDIAFFFAGASAKLKQLSMTMPVFTTYVAELPAVIPLVEGVYYSFPADITAEGGAVYGLSKQASELLVPLVLECNGNPECVRAKLISSGKFDQDGVYKRDLILKQIKNSTSTVIN